MNLNWHEGAGQRLLVLTPTGRDSTLAVELLKRCGFKADPFTNVEQLSQTLGSAIGALIIADEALTPGAVAHLTSLLEQQPTGLDIPVIILTRRHDRGSVADSFPSFYRRTNVTVLERPIKTENFVSVVRSVLAGRHRQYEVRSLLDTLEKRIQERDKFLAMLAHELRNPLSVITNALTLISYSAESKISRPLELATRQAKVISRLLDDLLDVARFANGKVTVEKYNVALSTVIHNAIDACARSMLQKRQHFTHDLGRDVAVHGDPIRLTQLFSNLLINASKYTPEGGQIGLHCDAHDSTVNVSIRDNGIGMGPELLARLFEPFAQGEQGIERSQGGLGLGLALAKSIAELHGGSISASSKGIGSGSEFTVSLPVTGGEAREANAEPASINARHAGPLRIMLAEDDADSAETLQAILSNEGYDVQTVKDGRSAIKAASVFRPQVILLDIGLPEMNGYELAQELRKRTTGNDVPLLVALSGYGRPEDLQRSRAAGIDQHLVKPLQLEKLQRILADFKESRH